MISFVEARSNHIVPFEMQDVILAGFSGRDPSAVSRHLQEMSAHGIPTPEKVPTLYRVTPDRVISDEQIKVLGDKTSGEAEFIMFMSDDQLYVGVGSDHTDRALERLTISSAKQACPKVVSSRVVLHHDIASHWDDIILRSSVGTPGDERRYQDGHLRELLPPGKMMSLIKKRIGRSLEGVLVFSGTLPLLKDMEYSNRFVAELIDVEHDIHLRCAYEVHVSDHLDS